MLKHTRPMAALLVVSAFLLTQTACPKSEHDRNVAFARSFLSSTRAVEAIIVADRPDLQAKWDKVIDNAGKLVEAVAASDSTSTAKLIRDILPTFNEVAAAFTNNRNFLIAIAVGEVALDFFIAQFPQNAVMASRGDPVAVFRNRAKITCRASGPVEKYKAGQYAPMSICEKYPDNTEVERRR